jgi:hypothetical protein
MYRQCIVRTIGLVFAILCTASVAALGQTPADSAARPPTHLRPVPDSLQRRGISGSISDSGGQTSADTALAPRASSDTLNPGVSRPYKAAPDTPQTATPSADSALGAAGLAPTPKPDSTKRDSAPPRPTALAAPRDSILEKACGGGTATLARDLLVVLFAPDVGARGRAAVAKKAGGKLVGQVSASEPGAYYLRVPSGGNEFQLRTASDELAQLPQVRQVGSRACPAPAPAKSPAAPQSPPAPPADSQAPASPR